MQTKTSTDLFWNERPTVLDDHRKVNIDDLVQRDVENQFILKHLNKDDTVLEVGCGNGYLTSTLRQHVAHVDGFDYAENMIAQAKEVVGEENNTFFTDNLLAPANVTKQYDAVVCVRVLINLKDLEEQKKAVENLKSFVKPGGRLILIEGFLDGFEHINTFRKEVNMPELSPAKINFYSHFSELEGTVTQGWEVNETFHTGMFDFLTRVVYPSLTDDATSITGPGEFHDKVRNIVLALNPSELSPFGRLKGWALTNK